MSNGFSIDGLASSLGTSDIINRLIELEKRPQDLLKEKLANTKQTVSAYQALNTRLQALHTAARDFGKLINWNPARATSSNAAVATATAVTGAPAASLSFTVDQLATGNTLISSGSVPSLIAPVYSGNLLLSTAGSLGFASLAGDAALTLGGHAISVTQATGAATKTATGAPTTLTIDGTNNALNVEVDGVVKNYTIASATYANATALAQAVQTASNGDLTASIDANGRLVLKTVNEGSAHNLKVNASTSLAALSLTTDVAAVSGTDGSLTVDGNVTTITSTKAGVASVLNAGGGATITGLFAGGLRTGSVTATNVDTGDGTLSAVTNAINTANVGITATAIQSTPGNFRLQLSSTTTGAKSAVTLPADAFGALGSLQTLTAGQDASLTVGTGPAAYTVTSSSNAVSNVLSGVTINLVTTGSASVAVAPNPALLADKAQELAALTNDVLDFVKANAAYDLEAKRGGPFTGDFAVRTLADGLLRSIVGGVSTSTLGNPAAAGFATTKEGRVNFDRAKFLEMYGKDPKAVQALFAQGGSATSTRVTALSVNDRTQTETAFPIAITQAAEQAKATGTEAGPLAAPETIDVKFGAVTVSYAAQAGETLTQVAAGLNAALQSQSLGVVATVQGGFLVLSTPDYGLTATFEVRSNASGAGSTGISTAGNVGAYVAYAGKNVEGTINGVASTGSGQVLSAPLTDPILAGLALRITATPAEVGALGTFTVVNGVSQRLSTRSDAASASDIGTITTNIASRKSAITELDQRIADWDRRLAARQTNLRRQFTAMETALSQLKSQGQWLTGQLAQLQANAAANSQ